jgi:hypothetical protein
MKNAFSRMGRTCASLLAGGVLMAGAMLANQINEVTVTLPHAVTVGSTTLPAGQYVIGNIEMGGEEFFVVRGDHTPVVTLKSEREPNETDKTEVVLSKDGDQWHFDKLTIAGEGETFRFVNSK